jgi:hypothetical protein
VAEHRRVAIYGTGDAAELVFLLVRDMGLELVVVFGPEPRGQFLGFPVQAIADHATVAYDVLIVATLERPAGTVKLLRRAGVPDDRMLMVRPDWTAAKATKPEADAGSRPHDDH